MTPSSRHVGMLGVILAGAGVWLMLPPFGGDLRDATDSYELVPVYLGLLAIFAGLATIVRGEARWGWAAALAGLLAIVVGFAAAQGSLADHEAVFVWSSLIAATLRWATPLTFAAIGGLLSERSGVVNLALEGMMLSGAFFGIWGADRFGTWWWGLVSAAVAGGLFALVHAFFAIHLRADQIVSGTAINFLALGVTGYLYIDLYGAEGTPPDVSQVPDIHLAFLDDVGFIGPIFAEMNLMIWLSLATVVLSWVVLFKTPLGLRIRAVGEHPRAADTVGISVYLVALLVRHGVRDPRRARRRVPLDRLRRLVQREHDRRPRLHRSRGAHLRSVETVRRLLRRTPLRVLERPRAVASEYSEQAALLFETLPYVLTLIAVAGVIGRSIPPAAIGRPYEKQ